MGRNGRARSMAGAVATAPHSRLVPPPGDERQQAPASRQTLVDDEASAGMPLSRPEWREQPFDLSSRPWC